MHSKYESRVCDLSKFCKELTFEVSAVFVDDLKTIVLSVYHSPNGNANEFLIILEHLLHFIAKWSNYDIILGGDLNDKFNVKNNTKTVMELLNLFKQHNFYYLNDQPTRGNKCLDNVFVYKKHAIISFVNIFQFPYSDHDGIIINIVLPKSSSEENPLKISNIGALTKFHLPSKNIDHLCQNLASYDWQHLLRTFHNKDPVARFRFVFDIVINNLNYF